MSGPAIVHVVDDDASFLRSVSRLLRAQRFDVRTFQSAAELLGQISPDTRGCVVADLNMPQLDGLALQQELADSAAPLPVVFLTGRGDIPTSVRAMRKGAVDFLEKSASPEALIAAIKRALDAGDRQGDLRQRFASLSERELEVLRHVVRGRMNKQIAAELGIHERTVKLHRTAITTKLGVRSVAELTSLSREAGIA